MGLREDTTAQQSLILTVLHLWTTRLSATLLLFTTLLVYGISRRWRRRKEINSMFRLWMRLVCLSCTIQRCGLTWKESLLGLHTLTSATPQQQASMALPMEWIPPLFWNIWTRYDVLLFMITNHAQGVEITAYTCENAYNCYKLNIELFSVDECPPNV